MLRQSRRKSSFFRWIAGGMCIASPELQMPSVGATAARDDDSRMKLLDAAMKRHRHQPDALIEILHTAQALFGYLDIACLQYVSRGLKVPPSRVYGVATFYNIFSLNPRGEHSCVVCMGTACYVKGATSILDAIEKEHHLEPGGTTADGRISLSTARCLGACGPAPVLVLDSEIVGGMTADSALARLQTWSGHDDR
jgi:bidirectional [NiFe] hydrogenase diaphorase subunit